MTNKPANAKNDALVEFLLRLGDDRLILGHRLSEWCGHAPVLEEDIALANIALDLLGQASALLHLAGETEGKNRSEDDLAYFREATQFRNLELAEQPNGDFAFTIARLFFFSAFNNLLNDALQKSSIETLAGIAAKGYKESVYHLRHSKEWMLRLGDGTEESHRRLQNAVNELWRFTGEMFAFDEVEKKLQQQNIVPSLNNIASQWNEITNTVLAEATVAVPAENHSVAGSRLGIHGEHLGHLLAEMQILPRSYPDATW
ncbi:MAG: phenylacetate-CoA oxygenase subunit PaaC [Bacteroidota bacterium]|nr:phenylacetate-CoA oxygenase subunit PaaC [Bacteroidota bacterium]